MVDNICKRCGNIYEIEWGIDGNPHHPEAWCDECNDYPLGWCDGLSAQVEADYLADIADRGKDRAKYGDI